MKNLGIYVGVMGLLSLTANASEKPFQVYCKVSTRVVAGNLELQVNPGKKYLGYDFEKYHAIEPTQNYQIKGSNQAGFGYSARSNSSVSVTESASGDLKIVAVGKYYDRATPVGEDLIEVLLKKTPYESLGGYSLGSFVVNGTSHQLEGPSHCELVEESPSSANGSTAEHANFF